MNTKKNDAPTILKEGIAWPPQLKETDLRHRHNDIQKKEEQDISKLIQGERQKDATNNYRINTQTCPM